MLNLKKSDMRLENIRFKGKRLDNGQWVVGDLLHSYDDGVIIIPITKVGESKGGAFSVDPSTVCQYTGLKDKEGREIWEGDIVSNGTPNNGIIIYHEGGFCLDKGNYLIWHLDALDPESIMVLGSKFDKEVKK